MNDDQLRGMAAQTDCRMFCRQALRFIIEIGGPEALDRFEQIVRPSIATRPDTTLDFDRMRDLALEMIDDDLRQARESPDLI